MQDKNLCLQYLQIHNKDVNSYWGICDLLVYDTKTWLLKNNHKGSVRILYIVSTTHDGMSVRARNKDLRIINPENVRVGAENFFRDEDGDPVLEWYFHAVLNVDGKIHDVWKPEVVDKENYFSKGFKQNIEVIPEEAWRI